MTAPPPVAGHAVRCTRLEVVDGDGRVRVIAGDLSPTAGYGIAVLDPEGARRIVAALDADGPVIVLDQHGTIAIEIGVHDHHSGDPESPPAGSYALVNDATGRPVVGLRVDPAGAVTIIGIDETGGAMA